MSQLPKVRTANIIIQEMDKELLIYDLHINKAFSLNETSAFVWQLCDGKSSIAELSQIVSRKWETAINDEFIWLTLNELKKNGLLENADEIATQFDGLSRREIVKKVGLASMIALPVISSVIAPSALMAQSACLDLLSPCSQSSSCCTGSCRPELNGSTLFHCCAESNIVVQSRMPDFMGTLCYGPPCDDIGMFYCCSGVAVEVPGNCTPTSQRCQCI
jgi:hypothetical protein